MKLSDFNRDQLNLNPRIEREIEKIQKMTSNNEHTKALIIGAKLTKNKEIEKKMIAIQDIHNAEGRMSPDVAKVRERFAQEIYKLAKKQLSAEEYEVFYGAY